MAEKELVIEENFDHSGIFDFNAFYKFMHGWLDDEGFGVIERRYSEKISGNTRDIAFEWFATKAVSDYFRIEIKMKFEAEKLNDVEVEIDGDKKKMNKGKVKGKFEAALVKDPDSKWDRAPFTRFMRDVYNKYIIPARIGNMQEEVRKYVITFKEAIKRFLELSGRRD